MSHGPQTGAAHSERKGDAVRLRWASADGPGAARCFGAASAGSSSSSRRTSSRESSGDFLSAAAAAEADDDDDDARSSRLTAITDAGRVGMCSDARPSTASETIGTTKSRHVMAIAC